MSLNITIVAPWGIWQCSDHRLTNLQTGAVYDHYSMKQVTLHCPDGAALITYAGIGNVGTSHVSDWLRRQIRGESYSLDETLILIRERASKWIGPQAASGKYPHVFSIGAFFGSAPWVLIITNHVASAEPAKSTFDTCGQRIDGEPLFLVTGMKEAVAPEDIQLLTKVVKKKPRQPDDYHKLLADINCRASKHPKYGRWISPACVTAFMPPKGEPVHVKEHRWDSTGLPEDRSVPVVFHGIDATDLVNLSRDRLKQITGKRPLQDEEQFKRSLQEAGRRAVRPDKK